MNYLLDKKIAASAIISKYCDLVGTSNVSLTKKNKLISVMAALEPIRHKIEVLSLCASSSSTTLNRPIISKFGDTFDNNLFNFAINSDGSYKYSAVTKNPAYAALGFSKEKTGKDMFFTVLDIRQPCWVFQGNILTPNNATVRYGWHPVWSNNTTYVDIGEDRFTATQPNLSVHKVLTLNVKSTGFNCYASKTSYLSGVPKAIPSGNSPYIMNGLGGVSFSCRGFAFGQALEENEISILVDALTLW